MYTLMWPICDPEMNFGVMPVGCSWIEIGTHKTCFLDAKIFVGIETKPIFDQVFLVFHQKKKKCASHEWPEVYIKD